MTGKVLTKFGKVDTMKKAFTLIELLVVIAIIALLMSILVPSLNRAKQAAYAIKCAAGAKNVGTAVVTYVGENGFYPASYLYSEQRMVPEWDIYKQDMGFQSNGYIHWSYFLFGDGKVDQSAFECPAIPRKGIPRTNPGDNADDWEKGQVDMDGQEGYNANLEDFQAPRIAFTGNASLIPRNKFKESYRGNFTRFNKFVRDTEVKRPGNVVLATEFNKDWRAISVGGTMQTEDLLVKSHRPITAFHSEAGDSSEYQADRYRGFVYGDPSSNTYGILAEDYVNSNAINEVPLNAVGRHHPGKYGGDITGVGKDYGESANFLFADGHVERMHIIETAEKGLWGDTFYSITGKNSVEKP